jgi:hypothetical protein
VKPNARIGPAWKKQVYPGVGWVFRDVEMENLASIVFDDEETIQDRKERVGTVKKSMAVMTSR